MKTTSIEKTIELADGLKVVLTMNGESRVGSVYVGERAEPLGAELVLRLAEVIKAEDRRLRHVCADHGEYQPGKSYLCPKCQDEEQRPQLSVV